MPDSRSPIGVFDSGVGGLTVLKALIERLPRESTVYLGDTARVPYGTKSAEVVTRYSLKNAELLMEHGIKALVVACNTASAVALPALEKALSIPVVGVIEAGAQAAAHASRSGHVAVIGTPGTIASGAYQKALEAARPWKEIRVKSCPLFVPLAEEGWTHGVVPRLVASEYLTGFVEDDVDTLVLGCTHYPLLREVLQDVVGQQVRLVDSGKATAERVFTVLHLARLLNESTEPVRREFLVTDVPGRFLEVSGRFLGTALTSAQQVDLKFGS